MGFLGPLPTSILVSKETAINPIHQLMLYINIEFILVAKIWNGYLTF